MKILFNISNHPSNKWDEKQLQAAKNMADVIKDCPFPNVPPTATSEEVRENALEIANCILSQKNLLQNVDEITVHIMGEMTLTFATVAALQNLELGIRCVASCTERNVIELPDGTKQSKFEFVQFRTYPAIALL